MPQKYEPVPSAPPEYNPAWIASGEDNAAPSATVAVDPYRRPTQVLVHSSKSDGLVFFAVTAVRRLQIVQKRVFRFDHATELKYFDFILRNALVLAL